MTPHRPRATRNLPTSLEPNSLMVGEAGDFKRLRDPPQALSFTEAGAFLLAHTAGYILGLVVPHIFAMPVGSSSRTMATTRGRCSTTSGTRTFSTRSGTPKWRPTGSRTFGGTDDGGAGSIAPHGRSPPVQRRRRAISSDHEPGGVNRGKIGFSLIKPTRSRTMFH